MRPASLAELYEPAESALAQIERWKAAGESIVFANGCFDILHIGHLTLLHEAAAMGDRLVVGINSDASVRALKGPDRPIVTARERYLLLRSLSPVDAVIVFDDPTPFALIQQVVPNVLVKGGDYAVGVPETDPRFIVGSHEILQSGGLVHVVPPVPNRSTTRMVERTVDNPE